MFEGQPKGLYALALANTGERFGYYTMLAIFTLFLQAKFGYTATETSTIFASFLGFVYFMPLIGGILADKFGYGKITPLHSSLGDRAWLRAAGHPHSCRLLWQGHDVRCVGVDIVRYGLV